MAATELKGHRPDTHWRGERAAILKLHFHEFDKKELLPVTSVPRRRTFGRRRLTADFRSAAVAQRGFARVLISAKRGAR